MTFIDGVCPRLSSSYCTRIREQGDVGDGDAIDGEGYEKVCGGSSDGLGDLQRQGDGGGLWG